MSAEIVSALIAAISAILVAGASYLFAKKSEREAAWRKEKLDHYKAFTASLSGVITGESTSEGQVLFARACNDLNLIAPQPVIMALRAFQEAIKIGNSASDKARHDQLMSKLFYELRRDLGVSADDDPNTFEVGLWASGAKRAGQLNRK